MAEIASANWKSDTVVNTREDYRKVKLERDLVQFCYWALKWKSTERSVGSQQITLCSFPSREILQNI